MGYFPKANHLEDKMSFTEKAVEKIHKNIEFYDGIGITVGIRIGYPVDVDKLSLSTGMQVVSAENIVEEILMPTIWGDLKFSDRENKDRVIITGIATISHLTATMEYLFYYLRKNYDIVVMVLEEGIDIPSRCGMIIE